MKYSPTATRCPGWAPLIFLGLSRTKRHGQVNYVETTPYVIDRNLKCGATWTVAERVLIPSKDNQMLPCRGKEYRRITARPRRPGHAPLDRRKRTRQLHRRLITLDRRREEGEDEVISDRRFITAPAMHSNSPVLWWGFKELEE